MWGVFTYRRLRASSAANLSILADAIGGKHARNRAVERNRFYGEVMGGRKPRGGALVRSGAVSPGSKGQFAVGFRIGVVLRGPSGLEARLR